MSRPAKEKASSSKATSAKRRKELQDLFAGCKAGLVFVTAFETRRTMQTFISHIAWKSEVWIADDADRRFHFNSERFLGPHPDDLLNVALFGQTARQWRDTLPEAECKIRDHAHGNSVYSGTPRQTASEGKLSLFAEKVSKST